ncbi:hypothetical protein GCM10010222_34710 [Streptomyces tanashiensis]|uniref:hypothetical protein n=1 Tax=Streptomyces tanashiensis TaxID=67367 RepID=UPI001676AFC6|nr:hypothetical protein [Streptomyces tanashiensis]GGS90171.1 hypothetical protein GCM10010222_34710 [Streptomyces tanashiensis]
MKNVTTRRRARLLASVVAALLLGAVGAPSTYASPDAQDCPAAQIFATDNTAVITDPEDPRLDTRLTRFRHEVRRIIRAHGARPGPSELLDGVFWSEELKQATYERSREFDVERVGRDGLHHIAGVIAKQYRQEAVLTFRCLPRISPETDAVEIEVPGVRVSDVRDALVADPEARDKLGGGSVALDGRLVLVAPVDDLPLARRFTTSLGADWDQARVRYGDREFVS